MDIFKGFEGFQPKTSPATGEYFVQNLVFQFYKRKYSCVQVSFCYLLQTLGKNTLFLSSGTNQNLLSFDVHFQRSKKIRRNYISEEIPNDKGICLKIFEKVPWGSNAYQLLLLVGIIRIPLLIKHETISDCPQQDLIFGMHLWSAICETKMIDSP